MIKELRRLFFVGVFTAAPLALTIYLLMKLFGWFDSIFQPLVHPIVQPYFMQDVPGLGIVVGLLFILMVGLMAPSLIGKHVILIIERAVNRVPLAKLIYSGTKQIFDSFSESQIGKFNRVVLVPFPRDNSYSIGFVTHETHETWVPGKHDMKMAVFIPTTPNPTSGYLLFVSPKDAISLSISVEDALKLIISGGLVRPPNFHPITKVGSV